MQFDLNARTARLSVGEFADFSIGPAGAPGSGGGLWRAQLGTHWHQQMRAQTLSVDATAEFEIPIEGAIVHRGWTIHLGGRIDQLLPARPPAPNLPPVATLREIKTVMRPLPVDETELRRDYPEYFIQLATYVALRRKSATGDRAELVFVETGSGLAQTITLTPADEALFRAQLERITEFLDLRLRARARLQNLRYRPAFATPRPGQETTTVELTATFERQPLVVFEAPTGFGKTGVLLEFALGQLRAGHFDRVLYLTSKSTGQLQVLRTLNSMTEGSSSDLSTFTSPLSTATPSQSVAAWQVRAKSEHCINTVFHCSRETCSYLEGIEQRWPRSGLSRFYLLENQAHDMETLRAAGREARICPYEITRAALAFNDVWIGDYNYVFSPATRGLFFDQPGFDPARTLLLIDEAHNLPSRVADAYSHAFSAADAMAVREAFYRQRPLAKLVNTWDEWTHFLATLEAADSLSLDAEDDARDLILRLNELIANTPLDYEALGTPVANLLWQVPSVADDLAKNPDLPRLWWSPRAASLALTCLDAATAIGAAAREFGGVVLATATPGPLDAFTAACGLETTPELTPPTEPPPSPDRLGTLTKRDTRKLYRQLTTAADLLRVEEATTAASAAHVLAHTPWREGSYTIGYDLRVDTTFQNRTRSYPITAATIAALHAAAVRHAAPGERSTAVAVFFSSYAYAEAVARECANQPDLAALRVVLQPRLTDLAAQSAWVDESLLLADALFLVLGSSFAESIDALGGRISHAMVVGPALPEVNAVQRARLANAERAGATREEAFRRVYQIPGMTKVNQALGRLVRAPGQRTRVLLHCRRFAETRYASLLAPDYQFGTEIHDDSDFAEWLAQ